MNTNAIDTNNMHGIYIHKQRSNEKQLIMYIGAFELHYREKEHKQIVPPLIDGFLFQMKIALQFI